MTYSALTILTILWLVITLTCGYTTPASHNLTLTTTAEKGVVDSLECFTLNFISTECSWKSSQENQQNQRWTYCVAVAKAAGDSPRFYDCNTTSETRFTSVSEMLWGESYRALINESNSETVSSFNFTLDQGMLSAPNVSVAAPVHGSNTSIQWFHQCQISIKYAMYCRDNGLQFTITLSVIEEITPDIAKIQESQRLIVMNGTFKLKSGFAERYKPTSILLPQLLPHTHYRLSMRQKMNIDGISWSETTKDIFVTPEQVPDGGPFIHRNSFTIDRVLSYGSDQLLITIYWKGLEVHSGGNGVVTSYRLLDKYLPASCRQHAMLVSSAERTVSIYASNSAGKSTSPSVVVIPKVTDVIDIPSCLVRVQEIKNKTDSAVIDWRLLAEYLSSQQKKDVNYTVFWCLYIDGSCQKEFDWLEIAAGSNATEHILEMTESVIRYKYGIGVTSGGDRSGVVWADCILGSDAPGDHDVDFTIKRFNSTHTQVEIKPLFVNGMSMIESIDLHYCQRSVDSCVTLPSVTVLCEKVLLIELDTSTTHSVWITLTYQGYSDVVKYQPKMVDNQPGTQLTVLICLLAALGVFACSIAGAVIHSIRRQRSRAATLVTTIQPERIIEEMKQEPHARDEERNCQTEDIEASSVLLEKQVD